VGRQALVAGTSRSADRSLHSRCLSICRSCLKPGPAWESGERGVLVVYNVRKEDSWISSIISDVC
jgi:hypothetical protein